MHKSKYAAPSQNKTTGRTSIASVQLEVSAVVVYLGSASEIVVHFCAFLQVSFVLVCGYRMSVQQTHECRFHQGSFFLHVECSLDILRVKKQIDFNLHVPTNKHTHQNST